MFGKSLTIFDRSIQYIAQIIGHRQKIQKKKKMNTYKTIGILTYQEKYKEYRDKYIKSKTMQQIRGTSLKQIQTQFKVQNQEIKQILSSAEIQETAFNLDNQKMNRYTDIFAYQHSRVKVEHIPNYYINANQVKSLVDGQVFAIFSQAPVKNYDNFWEAAYYKNVTVVVMLCSFYDPKRGHQSEQYWPDYANHATFSTGKLKVTNTNCDNNDKEYIINKFEIHGPQGVKNLTHIHWMGWSDLKKPVQSNMNRFQEIVSLCLEQIEKKNLIWVHCSAGIGRTGTLGGVIEALRLYNRKRQFSIFQIVENMRNYRYHAVQTGQQYEFLYQYLGKKLQ